MIYQTYDEYRRLYDDLMEQYNELLMERERLFQTTQPKAIDPSREKVNGGSGKGLEEYIVKVEAVDEQIAQVKFNIAERRNLMRLKEDELRRSGNIYDVIYVYRFIDHRRAKWIAGKLHYSRSQIYRVIDSMEKKMRQNATKAVL